MVTGPYDLIFMVEVGSVVLRSQMPPEFTCYRQYRDTRKLPGMYMAEKTDGVPVITVAGFPCSVNFHIGTEIHHAKWTAGR